MFIVFNKEDKKIIHVDQTPTDSEKGYMLSELLSIDPKRIYSKFDSSTMNIGKLNSNIIPQEWEYDEKRKTIYEKLNKNKLKSILKKIVSEFLSETDWIVIRHQDQLILKTTTSLTDEEYLNLLQDRNLIRTESNNLEVKIEDEEKINIIGKLKKLNLLYLKDKFDRYLEDFNGNI